MTEKERIRALIMSATNEEITRYVIMIVERQTPQERGRKRTIKSNGIGLNKNDAPEVTYCYRQIKRNVPLLHFQIEDMKKRLPKYWNQFKEMGL